jgi:energy-coupling factor transport system ATP-binding protein
MGKIAEVENLCHVYPGGVEALKNINLTIDKGQRIAIIGQNGSGKTTLSKHFNGLLRPTSGRVIVNGIDTATKSTGELARFVGYVYQNPNYQLFSTTVREEIEFGLKNIGLSESERKKRLIETLDIFDLRKVVNMQPLSFSSGVRKIVALASVYAMHPSVLFLDEPTTGQDHPGKEKIGELLLKMSKEGQTIIVVTHDMNFVAKFTERVIVMARGEIIKDGSPLEIFSDRSVMEKAHIEPPQIFKLASRLNSFTMTQNIINSKEMAQSLVLEGVI